MNAKAHKVLHLLIPWKGGFESLSASVIINKYTYNGKRGEENDILFFWYGELLTGGKKHCKA